MILSCLPSKGPDSYAVLGLIILVRSIPCRKTHMAPRSRFIPCSSVMIKEDVSDRLLQQVIWFWCVKLGRLYSSRDENLYNWQTVAFSKSLIVGQLSVLRCSPENLLCAHLHKNAVCAAIQVSRSQTLKAMHDWPVWKVEDPQNRPRLADLVLGWKHATWIAHPHCTLQSTPFITLPKVLVQHPAPSADTNILPAESETWLQFRDSPFYSIDDSIDMVCPNWAVALSCRWFPFWPISHQCLHCPWHPECHWWSNYLWITFR